MPTLDDEIARALQQSIASGELARAPSFGKPLAPILGFDETPAEFRWPFKILKDAGCLPPEVEAFSRLAAMRSALAQLPAEDPGRGALERQIEDLQLAIDIRLERLRVTRSL